MFPFAVWAKLMREELSSNQRNLLTKPPFEGVYELRYAISEHLKQFRNITACPEQIIIGAGAEYLYMLMNILFGNSYIFAVEDPGYSIFPPHTTFLPERSLPLAKGTLSLSGQANPQTAS